MLLEDAEGDDDATTISNLSRIRDAGHYLLKLVNKILDLSRLEAGKMDSAQEWVDCNEVVVAVMREVGALAEKNGDALSFVKQDELGLIRVDALKLKQALTNILENAAQYTRNGTITVTARRGRTEGDDRNLAQRRRHRPGDRARAAALPAQQLRDPRRRRQSLRRRRRARARALQETLRPHRRQSQRGERSRARQRLHVDACGQGRRGCGRPRDRHRGPGEEAEEGRKGSAALASAMRAEREKSKGAQRMPKLLLVEDNEANRDMLSRRLVRHGFQVVCAVDGPSAISGALRERPDVILMDVALGEMDGWQATLAIKASPATARIPDHRPHRACAGDRSRQKRRGGLLRFRHQARRSAPAA